MNIKRVLYPTDLSACSLAALGYAAELASSFGAELHILYVEDLRDLVTLAAYTAPGFVTSSALTELEEQLRAIKPTLAGVRCAYHYVEGIPADQICAFEAVCWCLEQIHLIEPLVLPLLIADGLMRAIVSREGCFDLIFFQQSGSGSREVPSINHSSRIVSKQVAEIAQDRDLKCRDRREQQK